MERSAGYTELDDILPQYLSGNELLEALSALPEYDPSIRHAHMAARMSALSDIYYVYVPTGMTVEIYNKIYFALKGSLAKKDSQLCIAQGYENHSAITGRKRLCRHGIIGGSDSLSIIGVSGIGKSAGIGQAVRLVGEGRLITTASPFRRLIPVLIVQIPFDCSPKGMLLQILQAVDERLGTDYYQSALRARATQDMLIGSVSQVCMNHIGLLVVDESQNVIGNKNGRNLVGMLTQLINASGTGICFVGTPEVASFFEQTPFLARRTIGLYYGPMEYNDEFCRVCGTLLEYCFTSRGYSNKEALMSAVYELSGGTAASAVSLLHDAQEIAILSGREILDLQAVDEAWRKRMGTLHMHTSSAAAYARRRPAKLNAGQRQGNNLEADNAESLVRDGDASNAPETGVNVKPCTVMHLQTGGAGGAAMITDIVEQAEEEGKDLFSALKESGLLEELKL